MCQPYLKLSHPLSETHLLSIWPWQAYWFWLKFAFVIRYSYSVQQILKSQVKLVLSILGYKNNIFKLLTIKTFSCITYSVDRIHIYDVLKIVIWKGVGVTSIPYPFNYFGKYPISLKHMATIPKIQKALYPNIPKIDPSTQYPFKYLQKFPVSL